ncbi:MAG: T9SS type A sorting domain-containing protein [Bacteroidales bacterium]|nr:T9SS type A sorting domain-containing protein [Bacteroidales bacterium]
MKKIIILFVLSLVGFISVSYADPSVSVISVDNITATKARFRGNIQQLGNRINDIKTRGFLIIRNNGSSSSDTVKFIENAPKKNEMYSYEITEFSEYLMPGTDYVAKAFITLKKVGADTEYVYSEAFNFSTIEPINDYSTVAFADNITLSTASLKGTIDSMGNADILEDCGFVYSIAPNPTLTSANSQYLRSTFNSNKLYPKQITSELSGLNASTTYYYRIWVINRYNNNYADTSYSEQKSFVTLHACGSVPQKLDTVYVHSDKAELKWEAQEGQNEFEFEYGFSGHVLGEGKIIKVSTTHITLDSLESNRSYTCYVRAVCPDKNSEWSMMRPFHTLSALCEKVSGLHVDHATHITAKIDWASSQEDQTTWEVLFARNDDIYPSKPFVVTGKPTYFPVGLTINTEYKVKVRTLCTIRYDTIEIDSETGDTIPVIADSNTYSVWSDELVFRTAASSLEEGEEIHYDVAIFPNPADGIINFSSSNDGKNVDKIEIYSLLGTLVYSNNRLPETLDTSVLGKGTFIIHITTRRGLQSEKIIIK